MSFAFLSIKLFSRKKSTVAAVLALTLLIATLASMYAIVNFIGSQTSALGGLARVGSRYLILSKDCPSLSGGYISPEIASALNGSIGLQSFYAQKIFCGNLQMAHGNFTVNVRGIENLAGFLKAQSVGVDGTAAKGACEANAGLLLSNVASLEKNVHVNVTVGDVSVVVQVVGIVRTQTQLDSELLVPIETANYLTGNSNLSFIEFTLKDNINRQDVVDHIERLLPPDVKVIKVQQTGLFLKQTTNETLSFLSVWSIAVYVLVAAASYVVSTRLAVESEYELAMLKAIGANPLKVSSVIFAYAMLVAFAGSVLGIAVGIVGTQVVSSVFRVWQNVQVTPFLEVAQVGQILVLSLAFSAFGCVYTAAKVARKVYGGCL
ncbi:MAG: FtsX-like permease family protein [Candidatus Bathyarchaeota archaeon]|nr:FtsX-like permease family protein [Candidatus Bathyarchaeota archaeon]